MFVFVDFVAFANGVYDAEDDDKYSDNDSDGEPDGNKKNDAGFFE